VNRSVNSSEQHALRGQPSEHKKVHIGFDQKVILWTEHEDESQKNVWDQNINFPNIISSVVCGS